VICRNRECIELKPDGCETMVTNENKQEYVQLCIKFVTQEFIKPSLGIILEEIYKVLENP
jgi:E3 ubiquitin-protein ligase HUWE1